MPGEVFQLDVQPRVPESLLRLSDLAENLWYSWHRPARRLFASLDPDLWEEVGHNPKRFLRQVDERVLVRAAQDPVYIAQYREVLSAFDTYLEHARPAGAAEGLGPKDLIAYFCAEYGLHESLHTYSGGLGILAGHHCKTASDLRLPFIAVGLLYRAGYFSQTLDESGQQIAHYVEADFEELPIAPVAGTGGGPLLVGIPFPDREVCARVWCARAGHASIYLLDTDVGENAEGDRAITRQLYGGGSETRIQQELVLGIGGVRALRSLGLEPTVWHLNEGHAAFSALERMREMVGSGADFDTAVEAVAAGTVFTTHTPVPAGHDRFPEEMALRYLGPLARELDLAPERLLALGRLPNEGPELNMTTLALGCSRFRNGVSQLHGEVSAVLCREMWPEVPPEENPITHVTNGVHIPTVLAQDWMDLFDRVLGVEWRRQLTNREYWQRLHDVPDALFWGVKQWAKAKMLTTVRDTLGAQMRRNRRSESHVERVLRYLDPGDPNVLTIGFARRFATYKRADLIFHDVETLARIAGDETRPVIFVFAGKAHPADQPGQALLRRIQEIGEREDLLGQVLLVEGYDLSLARRLFSGVDIWLNNPIYGTEASGTSGMKAAANGTIHLSVTDGWWAEGYEGDNGWAIKPSTHDEDPARRDREDAQTLYEILEHDALPRYYERGRLGYSPRWVAMSKRAMASVLPRFSMNRVVEEYARRLYVPAAANGRRLAEGDRARSVATWRRRVAAAWPRVALRLVTGAASRLELGESTTLEVAAALDGLEPDDVIVELHRDEGAEGGAAHTRFEHAGTTPERGGHLYRLVIAPPTSGRLRYRVRMYPHHPDLAHPFEAGLMRWVESAQ